MVFGDLNVVVKCRYASLLLLVSPVAFLLGCGEKPADPAINKALTQLDLFSRSRAVVFRGIPAVELTDKDIDRLGPTAARARKNQQEIKEISARQQEQFKQALDELKRVADEPAETPEQNRQAARAQTLLAAMYAYLAGWEIDNLGLFDTGFINLKNQIRALCIKMEFLQAEQAGIDPKRYDALIDENNAIIRKWQARAQAAEADLKTFDRALKSLNAQLADAIKRRDILNVKIGEITDRLNTVSPARAYELQKKNVQDLETERFKVLIEIEKLSAGPMTLPPELEATLDNQPVKDISGIKQLEQQKRQLETRLQRYREALAAQDRHLKEVTKQKEFAGQQSRQIARQLDNLTKLVKENLSTLDDLVVQRTTLESKTEAQIQNTIAYAQKARQNLTQFLGAVSAAKSAVASSGRDDPILKSQSEYSNLEFTIGKILINGQLDRARIRAQQLHFLEALEPILQRAQKAADLPVTLAKTLKTAPETRKTLATALDGDLKAALAQYRQVVDKARSTRGDLYTVVATSYALALNRAAGLAIDNATGYRDEARTIIDNVTVPGGAAPGGTSSDPLLIPVEQLKRDLKEPQ